MADAPDTRLRFKDIDVHVDVSFWYDLEKAKLVEWKLDMPEVHLTAAVAQPATLAATKAVHLANVATLDRHSFVAGGAPVGAARHLIDVAVVNFNTDEEMKTMDRKAVLAPFRDRIQAIVAADRMGAVPMTVGVMRTFADLKTHAFSYCTAFPVLDVGGKVDIAAKRAATAGAGALSEAGFAALNAYAAEHATAEGQPLPFAVGAGAACGVFDTASAAGVAGGTVTLAMLDHSAAADHPGWAWRNVISALRLAHPATAAFTILCLRDTAANSVVFDCTCDPVDAAALAAVPKVVGWSGSKLHRVEMGAMMDPSLLAASSAKLNLSLMKWRMMPDIDLEKIQGVKALLLGSGTLGCNIARHLMMWGVTNITMVDRGNVSFSNPVRQTLFELSDCTAEGRDRLKCVAAVKTLKRILPTANANAVPLTIRMPGHRIDAVHMADATEDIEKLTELIKAHDVVYLLTDSRESRWLPTLLCTAYDKPVINAALGFDSWVVMRHGLRAAAEKRVGCYFCADVVAPIDSLTARTLDQQCTVTRPGVSAIASAIGVEILASLMNHPLGFACPAHHDEQEDAASVLGILPHQIRGNVSDYSTMTLRGQAYEKCTACSDAVVDRYLAEGIPFLVALLNDPPMMEDVTGLKQEREEMAAKHANWDDDDDEAW
jgi:ubiquitin-like modifier-activating enzyme ATG7